MMHCECRDLHKSYGAKQVLQGCTFSVGPGEAVGLVGENGSGKSTLVRCLLGFDKPTRGSVALVASVGYCPQDNYLDRRLTLREHFDFLGEIQSRRRPVDAGRRGPLLEALKLGPYLDTLIGRLSGGTYQKVKFASAILHGPELVVLDEPCDGFDWAMYLVFWEIMKQLLAQGSAMLMISHFLHDRGNFTRILQLEGGRCQPLV